MKSKRILWIVVILYLLSMVAAFFITKSAVEKKDDRLREEVYKNLGEFFSQQSRYINIGYSGKTVAYEEIPIPPKPQKNPQTWLDSIEFSFNPYEKRLEEWNDEYGDLHKLYKLKPKYVSEYSWNSDREWSGWLFYGVELRGQRVNQFQIYPYEVGLKKQSNQWGYYYAPSIQEAVDASFDFHTANEKSSYVNDIVKRGDITINTVRDKVENEYYCLWSYDSWCRSFGKKEADRKLYSTDWSRYPVSSYYLPCEHAINDNNEYYCGGMYNGYYTVRNKCVIQAVWEIKYEWAWNPKARDLEKWRMWSFGALTLLFVICLIPLIDSIDEDNRVKNESLKEKLLRLCNPQLLVKDKPYSKDFIDKANSFYQEIISTGEGDKERLLELMRKASVEFGVTFISIQELERLKVKCNPQKYMKPYNPEKVALANELYSRITKEGLSYEEFVIIEKESEKL